MQFPAGACLLLFQGPEPGLDAQVPMKQRVAEDLLLWTRSILTAPVTRLTPALPFLQGRAFVTRLWAQEIGAQDFLGLKSTNFLPVHEPVPCHFFL